MGAPEQVINTSVLQDSPLQPLEISRDNPKVLTTT